MRPYKHIREIKAFQFSVIKEDKIGIQVDKDKATKKIDVVDAEIDACYGINRLPEKLRQFALMRIEHPEVSLKEIGAMMQPPVGKSAMNHRLRRMREILSEHSEKPGCEPG